MSPELMLRPSLSGRSGASCARYSGGVAGAYAPAFVERSTGDPAGSWSLAVSPELMLRPSLSGHDRRRIRADHFTVSPELMLRPSLSVRRIAHHRVLPRVAGAYAPAFVERSGTSQ